MRREAGVETAEQEQDRLYYNIKGSEGCIKDIQGEIRDLEDRLNYLRTQEINIPQDPNSAELVEIERIRELKRLLKVEEEKDFSRAIERNKRSIEESYKVLGYEMDESTADTIEKAEKENEKLQWNKDPFSKIK